MNSKIQQPGRGKREIFVPDLDMATVGLRDQERLEGASNYVIWKAKISFPLDEPGMKTYAENVVAVSTDADQLREYKKEMEKAKRMILDGVWDHIVSHISSKNISKQMCDALAQLYHNPSEHRKMFLPLEDVPAREAEKHQDAEG